MRKIVISLLWVLLCLYSVGWISYVVLNWGECDINYYATFESGETVKVDNIIAVPILSVEQIDRMWPEYYAETIVDVGGKEITLRSKPFLFCDNPELEGNYAGRDVYCPLAEAK